MQIPELDKLILNLKKTEYLNRFIPYIEDNFLNYNKKNNSLILSPISKELFPCTFEVSLSDLKFHNVEVYTKYTRPWTGDYGQAVLRYLNEQPVNDLTLNILFCVLDHILKSINKCNIKKTDCLFNTLILSNSSNIDVSLLNQFIKNFSEYFIPYITIKNSIKPAFNDAIETNGIDCIAYHYVISNKLTKFVPELANIDINLTENIITGYPENWNTDYNTRWGIERLFARLFNIFYATCLKANEEKEKYEKYLKRKKLVKTILLYNMCK